MKETLFNNNHITSVDISIGDLFVPYRLQLAKASMSLDYN